MSKSKSAEDRECSFNPETTCAEVMDNGNGHCCREYDQYEENLKKRGENNE